MILDLDDRRCLEPERVGAKAAWLARARRAGLPVLPGLVVEGRASLPHLREGMKTLPLRGPGGARLVVGAAELPFVRQLQERAGLVGPSLVVRSSSPLEDLQGFAGAFTSYIGLGPGEVAKGVAGCWASVFTVSTLELMERAGVVPDTVGMSVLVQPCLDPQAGGTATLSPDGMVTVIGTPGSPVGLLQGWSGGAGAVDAGQGPEGDLLDLVGEELVAKVASLIRQGEALGAGACEWAVEGDEVWLLQLTAARSLPTTSPEDQPDLDAYQASEMPGLAWLVAGSPGPLGDELVLPWAIAGKPEPASRGEVDLGAARTLAGEVAATVWGTGPDQAANQARLCLRQLRGPDPHKALEQIRGLRPPPPGPASRLLGLVDALARALVDIGAVPRAEAVWHLSGDQIELALEGSARSTGPARVGLGPWEPFIWSVVTACGSRSTGSPAAPGLAAGIRRHRHRLDEPSPPPRGVITALHPLPSLAPLLWDAAGVVAELGSPGAHLFDAARSLGVPAVCGVDLFDAPEDSLIAMDGAAGTVSVMGAAAL